ncbi:hypothetical protein GCM10025883_25580 [Mobilicoccus caccae]|uniref:Exonuclease VII large subunit C-terminal domain-containing protein n=1 Tax=Mobilicoccus caccae TaxID=1859295 RepID=A0ABQ6IT92_9MICO|nr:hypothetical protein GCM10025883_25580 [Mobilicoccus caccae]
MRASTPTDAAKRIVPDVEVERAGIVQAATRARAALESRIASERRHLAMLRDRPVLTDPHATLAPHRTVLEQHRDRAERAVRARLDRGRHQVEALQGQLRALSPQGTLDRGYAIVMHADGRIVSDRQDVDPQEVLRVRVARGDFGVRPVTRKARS